MQLCSQYVLLVVKGTESTTLQKEVVYVVVLRRGSVLEGSMMVGDAMAPGSLTMPQFSGCLSLHFVGSSLPRPLSGVAAAVASAAVARREKTVVKRIVVNGGDWASMNSGLECSETKS